jgi:hypothetical protein
MSDHGQVHPSDLPHHEVLRARHVAFAAVEELIDRPAATRGYGVQPPDTYRYESGSGDHYDLVILDDDALLMVFDHESPRSPFARDDGAREWPGMFDGLPDHLRARVPAPDEGHPLAVSTCFWFTGGAWHEGNPEPVTDDSDYYAGDAGGAHHVLASVLDPQAGIEELLEQYELTELLDEALALLRSLDPE